MRRLVCRLLIVLMAWTPYQIAQAGMIGTDQVVASGAQADRNVVLGFIGRADVAGQLQSFGIDAASAKERVAAMTDEELRAVASRIEAVPAGGNGSLLIIVIFLALIVWWVWKR